VQGLGISLGLESMQKSDWALVVPDPGWSFRLMTVLTLTAGTAFNHVAWEQITERGYRQCISLIIFAGIVARLPSAIVKHFSVNGDW